MKIREACRTTYASLAEDIEKVKQWHPVHDRQHFLKVLRKLSDVDKFSKFELKVNELARRLNQLCEKDEDDSQTSDDEADSSSVDNILMTASDSTPPNQRGDMVDVVMEEVKEDDDESDSYHRHSRYESENDQTSFIVVNDGQLSEALSVIAVRGDQT